MKGKEQLITPGSNDLIPSLAEHLNDGLLMVDESGWIIFANDSAARITGYSKEELIGQPAEGILIPAGGRSVPEYPIEHALRTKEPITYQSNSRGKEIVVHVIPTDFTAEAQSIVILSRATSREEDPRALRMQLLGQLTMGIAHDFNNALTSIICYTQLVEEMIEGFTPGAEEETERLARARVRALNFLRDVTKVSTGAAGYIRQLLAYARQQQLVREPIDLNEAVADTMYLARKLLGERITATFRPAEKLPLIYAERSQIDQVLFNLIVNARDAMPDGGELKVETSRVTLDESFTRTREWAKAGDFIRLSVSDTGKGMDRQTLDQVFTLFFTTKADGQGTGLGLPTIYGIVKQHNGYIDVQSQPGKGTRFDIYLPPASAQQRQASGPRKESADKTSVTRLVSKSLILVAEDNPTVRRLYKEIIKKAGARVVTTRSGDGAVKIYRRLKERGERIDLAILDIGLPGLDGRAACQVIQRDDPRIPVLLVSGYGTPYTEDQSIPEEGYDFLPKPFDGIKLLEKIKTILGRREAGGVSLQPQQAHKTAVASQCTCSTEGMRREGRDLFQVRESREPVSVP